MNDDVGKLIVTPVLCPTCFKSVLVRYADLPFFRCLECKAVLECVYCAEQNKLQYYHSSNPHFACHSCDKKWYWRQEPMIQKTKDGIERVCGHCGGFAADYYTTHLDQVLETKCQSCGQVAWVDHGPAKKKKGIRMARKPKIDDKSFKVITEDQYRVWQRFKKRYGTCLDEFDRYLDLKSDMQDSLRELLEKLAELKEALLGCTPDEEFEAVEKVAYEAEDVFSQIAGEPSFSHEFGRHDEMWPEEDDHDKREFYNSNNSNDYQMRYEHLYAHENRYHEPTYSEVEFEDVDAETETFEVVNE